MDIIIRNKCCICYNNLEDIITFKNYPISFSMTNDNKYTFEDLIFSECIKCKTIQIKNLIDLNILYNKPHNYNVIGKTWIEHFQEFSSMINKFKKNNDNVLEIGSPTDKIERYIDNYSQWVLMDPNCEKYPEKKIQSINDFFSEEYNFNCKFDTIIHSHLLEHLYEPNKMLVFTKNVAGTDAMWSISLLFPQYNLAFMWVVDAFWPDTLHLPGLKNVPPRCLRDSIGHFQHGKNIPLRYKQYPLPRTPNI